MMGDPFEDITVQHGILIISQSGGSSWKWSVSDKYRFQNNRLELIGHTSHYGKPCQYWQHFDMNMNTGKVIVTKAYERCEGGQEVYKEENEQFIYKTKGTTTFTNRKLGETNMVTPKYKHELHF